MRTSDAFPEIGRFLPPPELRTHGPDAAVTWGISPDRIGAGHRTPPWWLWWNILSFDAPAVATVWAAVFARAGGRKLSVAELVALGLCVWIIYMSDRLLDGWTARNRAALQDRHLFCERHRFVLGLLVVAASAVVIWTIAGGLQLAGIVGGVKLGVILILYMAAIHTGRGRVVRFLPKEVFVGMLFAAGTTLPLWTLRLGTPLSARLTWVFFGLLCFLNCLSIECWENHRSRGNWTQACHPFVHWADSRIHFIAAVLAVGALAACFIQNARAVSVPVWFAVSAGALLILMLNSFRARISSAALRVLADAALLVPALIALAMQG